MAKTPKYRTITFEIPEDIEIARQLQLDLQQLLFGVDLDLKCALTPGRIDMLNTKKEILEIIDEQLLNAWKLLRFKNQKFKIEIQN